MTEPLTPVQEVMLLQYHLARIAWESDDGGRLFRLCRRLSRRRLRPFPLPTTAMSIEEATTLKHELIKNITKMLFTFNAATGLSVDSIEVERFYKLGCAPNYIVDVSVKL